MATYSEDRVRTPTGGSGRAAVRAGLVRPSSLAGVTKAATAQAADPRQVAAAGETRTQTASTILPSAASVRTAEKQRLIDPKKLVAQALEGIGERLAPISSGPGGAVRSVIAGAKRYLGVPYLWGGTDPSKGLDCSGYTQLVFKSVGISLPRTSRQQAVWPGGRTIRGLANARPGDLIFYATNGRIHHVGIYAGNGMYYNAPHPGTSVRLARVGTPSLIRRVL